MRELLEVCVITKRALETVGEETREISRGKCVAYVISGHSASLLLFPFVFPGSLPNHVLTHLTPQGHWLTIRSWSYILNAPLIRRSGLQETEPSLSLLFVLGLPFSHLHQSSSLSPSVNSCTEALCPEHLHVSSRSEQWVSLVSSFFSLGALLVSFPLGAVRSCLSATASDVRKVRKQRQIQGKELRMLQCGSPKDTGQERESHPDSASSLLCDSGEFPFLGGKRRVLDEVSSLQTPHHHGPLVLFLSAWTLFWKIWSPLPLTPEF